MHISFGMPLISAEQEPHLPALQFHRTAMSGAWVACSRWITSSTTSPSFTSTVKSCRSPPSASPRHTLNFALYPMSALLRGDVGELAGGEVLRLLHLAAAADDADQVVHRLLQLGVHRVRVLLRAGLAALELGHRPPGRGVHIGLRDDRLLVTDLVHVRRRARAGPPAEHQQVG